MSEERMSGDELAQAIYNIQPVPLTEEQSWKMQARTIADVFFPGMSEEAIDKAWKAHRDSTESLLSP